MNRWIDWIVYYHGAYELDELELMRTLLAHRPRPVALDIGANVGHHALCLAWFCAEVDAFEPYDAVSMCLDEKVRRDGLAHIHLHCVGLGERDEGLDFFALQGANSGTGTFVAGHEPTTTRPDCGFRLSTSSRSMWRDLSFRCCAACGPRSPGIARWS